VEQIANSVTVKNMMLKVDVPRSGRKSANEHTYGIKIGDTNSIANRPVRLTKAYMDSSFPHVKETEVERICWIKSGSE